MHYTFALVFCRLFFCSKPQTELHMTLLTCTVCNGRFSNKNDTGIKEMARSETSGRVQMLCQKQYSDRWNLSFHTGRPFFGNFPMLEKFSVNRPLLKLAFLGCLPILQRFHDLLYRLLEYVYIMRQAMEFKLHVILIVSSSCFDKASNWTPVMHWSWFRTSMLKPAV